jgi:glycosyltransferase involved in cell wall biosynthesis
MEDCDAVCFPGQEDFGIVPVEANAAGKPVVAFAAGGALETLEDGRTGSLFREPTVEAVLGAIRRVRALDTSPEDLARSAERFSASSFRRNLSAAISRAGNRRHGLVPAVPESATAHHRARRRVHAQD